MRTARRRSLLRLVKVLTAVELTIACAAAALIFVLILFQAVQRYLPLPQITWTGELSQFALIWLTFVAAGVLVTRNGHIAIQLIDTLPSPTAVRVVQTLSLGLVALIAAGFAWACWELVHSAGFLTSPALGLPMSWVYAIAMIGLVSTVVRAVISAVQVARFGVPEPDGLNSDGPTPDGPSTEGGEPR